MYLSHYAAIFVLFNRKYVLLWLYWTRLGMELFKFVHCPLIFSSRNHTWITASIIFVFVVQSIFCNLALHMDQRFSIGLRSGEFPGQSRRVTLLSLKSFIITLETWQGTESNDWSYYSGVVPGREDQGTVQKFNQLHPKTSSGCH